MQYQKSSPGACGRDGESTGNCNDDPSAIVLDTWNSYLLTEAVKKGGVYGAQPGSIAGTITATVFHTLRERIDHFSAELRSRRSREESIKMQRSSKLRIPEVNSKEYDDLLGTIGKESMRMWADAHVERLEEVEDWMQRARYPSSTPPPCPGPSSIERLYRCLIDGMNSPKTMRSLEATTLSSHDNPWNPQNVGLDFKGLVTQFNAHIQALSALPAIAPPPEILVKLFAPLFQPLPASYPTGPLESSVDVAERQLENFISLDAQKRFSLLVSGAHPSVRRLLYAAALGISLRVSPWPGPQASTEAECDRQPAHDLSQLITFGSGKAFVLNANPQAAAAAAVKALHETSSQEARMLLLKKQLACVDANACVGNHEQYFVFAEEVESLVSSLVQSPEATGTGLWNDFYIVPRWRFIHSCYFPPINNVGNICCKSSQIDTTFFPVQGFSLLVAPICNVSADPSEQFALASAMTAQLWLRLSSPTPDLISCCLLFEKLVERLALPAALHVTRRLNCDPLLIALGWFLTGFSEVLNAAELLSFWDIVLAYNELERGRSSISCNETRKCNSFRMPTQPSALWLFSMLAASLFAHRASLVLSCKSAESVKLLFSTCHQVQVRPLLQESFAKFL